MPTFGKLDEYRETEEWRHYVERLNHFFEANEITDKEKRRSIFLVSVGAKTYKLIRSLLSPQDPKTRTYEELTKLVQDHYMPKPSTIVQRFKFNSRSQQSGETIPVFVAELRRLSEDCEFGTTLDERLRDRLVCGVRDDKIQRRLLAEPKLSLKRALELGIAAETAVKDALDLQKSTPSETPRVNKFEGKPTSSKDYKPSHANKCSRCDGKHNSSECRFKDAKCHACGKVGHISRACRSKDKGAQRPVQKGRGHTPHKPQTTHVLEGEREMEEDCTTGTYSMFVFGSQCSSPYRVNVSINGKPLQMELDTGASLSVMSDKMYQELWGDNKQPPLVKEGVVLRTYTGEEVKPKGSAKVMVSYEGRDYQLPLLVVRGDGPALLGRNWLEQIQLNWQMIKQLTTHKKQLDEILANHPELFEEGLGTLKGTTAKIHVDPTATPMFYKARPVPYALREKIELDLERLERAGTIQPVQYSEWATSIVPVLKTDGTVRVCGDYKLTVNKVSKLDAYPIPKLDDLYTKLAGGQTFTELDLSHAYEQMLVDEDSKEFLTINTHKGLACLMVWPLHLAFFRGPWRVSYKEFPILESCWTTF